MSMKMSSLEGIIPAFSNVEKCFFVLYMTVMFILGLHTSTAHKAAIVTPVVVPHTVPVVENKVSPLEQYSTFIGNRNYKVCPVLRKTIVEASIHSSKKYKIPVEVIMALMCVESTYKYDAVSSVNAVGLMQVNISVWRKDLKEAKIILTDSDLYVPSKNIEAGTFILNTYLTQGREKQKSNPLKYALTRYYGGSANSHYGKTLAILGDMQVWKLYETKQL